MKLPDFKEILENGAAGGTMHATVWVNPHRITSDSTQVCSGAIKSIGRGVYPDITVACRTGGLPGHRISEFEMTVRAGLTGELRRYERWRRIPTLAAVGYSKQNYTALDLLSEETFDISEYAVMYGVRRELADSLETLRGRIASSLSRHAGDPKAKAALQALVAKRIAARGDNVPADYDDVAAYDCWRIKRMLCDEGDLRGTLQLMRDAGLECSPFPLRYTSSTERLFRLAAKVVPVLWVPVSDLEKGLQTLSEEGNGPDVISRLAREVVAESEDAELGNTARAQAMEPAVLIYRLETKEVEHDKL